MRKLLTSHDIYLDCMRKPHYIDPCSTQTLALIDSCWIRNITNCSVWLMILVTLLCYSNNVVLIDFPFKSIINLYIQLDNCFIYLTCHVKIYSITFPLQIKICENNTSLKKKTNERTILPYKMICKRINLIIFNL